MFNKISLPLIIFFTVFLSATTANATRYYVNDYALDIMWKENENYLKIWGGISGDRSCENIEIAISFKNTETDSTRSGHVTINNFRPLGRNNYQTKIRIPSYNKQFHIKKGNWAVTDYDVYCLK